MIKSAPALKKRGHIAREDVENGVLEEMITEGELQGHFVRLPEAERDKSRWNLLADIPEDEDIWLFAYGSLIWSPMIHFVEQRHAELYGFHRQFCMQTKMGRGTPDRPGLMLALENGGSCKGIAYRVAAKDREQELKVIWNREMGGGSYTPKFVKLHTGVGSKKEIVRAIAFTMNHDHENYIGKLAVAEVAETLAYAEGPLGKGEDYLFNTVSHLEELGLVDHHLFKLARLIRALKGEA
ncbi:MAG: gamma-glutamylcyclotransferase [Rhodospirillaceae bacterium]|nr:gamma-glutamylcyclotransferase [Rhodospirillaceae bacterium]